MIQHLLKHILIFWQERLAVSSAAATILKELKSFEDDRILRNELFTQQKQKV